MLNAAGNLRNDAAKMQMPIAKHQLPASLTLCHHTLHTAPNHTTLLTNRSLNKLNASSIPTFDTERDALLNGSLMPDCHVHTEASALAATALLPALASAAAGASLDRHCCGTAATTASLRRHCCHCRLPLLPYCCQPAGSNFSRARPPLLPFCCQPRLPLLPHCSRYCCRTAPVLLPA